MIERYTNKEILRPCPPFGYARTPRRLRLLGARYARTPRRLWLLGARYARTPVVFGSLRVGC
uniref:hypothetical protein n=1 Tax=Collinsella aerofaciens TaxID=74426 RepID=UPI001E5744F0